METDIQIKIVFLFMLTESDKQKQWEGRKEGIMRMLLQNLKTCLRQESQRREKYLHT